MIMRAALCLLFLFVHASCTHLETARTAPPRTAQPPAQNQRHEARHIDVSPADPQRGLDALRSESSRHPNDQGLTRDYVKEVEDLRRTADKALENGNLTQAGRLYNTLLKNYAHFARFSRKLSFTRGYLEKRADFCKTSLSRKGFEEYRKGNIQKALDCWQGYLAIEPNNQDIRKAVQTASAQQKNLVEKR